MENHDYIEKNDRKDNFGNGCNQGENDQKNDKNNNKRSGSGYSLVNQNVHSASISAATIHIIGDMIQSIGVVIASVIILFQPTWLIVDPICTILFVFLVSFTTFRLIKRCCIVLMEAAPDGINLELLKKDLIRIKDVTYIEDIHIWSISTGKLALT